MALHKIWGRWGGNPQGLLRPWEGNQVLGSPGEDFMKATVRRELRGGKSREPL